MSYHYYPYINKIFTQLQLRDRLFSKLSQDADSEDFSRPFITVAREPGSGGFLIGKAVADKLGFTMVDDQIIEEIAQSTQKRTQVIKDIDEKARTNIGELIHSLLNPDYIDESKYVTELVRIILTYAHKGNSVILGRGANFITPFAKGLHINITAPYSVRVARAIEHEGHSESKAKKIIAKVEKERADFVTRYLNRDINKKNSYDLTINTSYLTVNQARDIILESFFHKFPRFDLYKSLIK
jgi:cytidylate kinase